LKIEKEFRDDHQVKLTVEFEPEPFEKAKHRAARQIAKKIKIPGFRPGKAPYGVILRQVGEGHVVEQALELLVEEQYPEIIKEAEIDPYGPGTLENVPELDPPTFEFIVPLSAEVELGDYKSISIPFEEPTIGDEDVGDAVEQAREQNAKRERAERPAEEGDVVFMRVSGVRTEVENEDDDPTIVEERFSSSVIKEEEEEDDEFPYPGFSQELIGLSADDVKKVQYQYPDDHEDETLRGVKAEFSVSVTNIQSVVLPEVDDDLAKQAGGFDSLDEWKADLRDKLEENAKRTYADEYDDSIIDKIVEGSEIKYPPQMMENEKAEILRGLEYQLSQQGLTKDLFMQIRGLDEAGLEEEIKPAAEQRVNRALVLIEIAKTEEIEIDQEQVQAETGRTIEAIASSMTPNEAKKFANSAYVPNLYTNIIADMTTKTTMDFLRATAKGEPWPPEEETKVEISDDADGESDVDALETEIAESEKEAVDEETSDEESSVVDAGEDRPDEVEAKDEEESTDEPEDEDGADEVEVEAVKIDEPVDEESSAPSVEEPAESEEEKSEDEVAEDDKE